jgi:hypothetical protein
MVRAGWKLSTDGGIEACRLGTIKHMGITWKAQHSGSANKANREVVLGYISFTKPYAVNSVKLMSLGRLCLEPKASS